MFASEISSHGVSKSFIVLKFIKTVGKTFAPAQDLFIPGLKY